MLTLRKRLKEEKGFTLVELLAVIVILGIIAAIAIPSIGKVIENSKKDAHISNAKMMLEAGRMAVANEEKGAAAGKYTLKELIDGGYLEKFKSPTKEDYSETDNFVEYNKESGEYTVTLNITGMPKINGVTQDKLDRKELEKTTSGGTGS